MGGGSFAIFQLMDRRHIEKTEIYGTDMHGAKELRRMEIMATEKSSSTEHSLEPLNRPSCLLTFNVLN